MFVSEDLASFILETGKHFTRYSVLLTVKE